MQIPVQYPTTPPSPPTIGTTTTVRGIKKRNIPQLHFLHEFNLLAYYAKEKDNPLIDVLLFSSYAI